MDIDELISYVKEHNDFYTALYDDIKEFKKLPFIDKKSLLQVFNGNNIELTSDDVKEGIFTRVTSGTSNMMGMFNHSESEIEASANRYKDVTWYLWLNGRDRVCIVHNYSLAYIFARHMLKCNSQVSFGNPYDLSYTVAHIIRTNSNIIRTSPTIALKLAPILKKLNHEVDYWILAGSGISKIVEKKIKENSVGHTNIVMQYGMAETLNSMHQPCGITGNDFCLFENGDFIYEFLDEDDNEVKPGVPGELVITRLSKDNPIIRYKTGDLFIKRGGKSMDGKDIYSIIGRVNDCVKINGVVVFKDKVDYAISKIKDLINGDYQIAFDEVEDDGIVKSELTLYVTPIEKTEETQNKIARLFEEHFEISEGYNWKKGIEDKKFVPVKVEFKEFKNINKINPIIDRKLEVKK